MLSPSVTLLWEFFETELQNNLTKLEIEDLKPDDGMFKTLLAFILLVLVVCCKLYVCLRGCLRLLSLDSWFLKEPPSNLKRGTEDLSSYLQNGKIILKTCLNETNLPQS